MSDVKRYRVRDLCSPTDLATLNAVYENAECVFSADYDAAIAAKNVEIERLRTALHKISLAERDSTSSSYEKEQDMAKIARAALSSGKTEGEI